MDAKRPEALDSLHAIGWIHSPFKSMADLPVQGTANNVRGSVTLLEQYAEGLTDLTGFDRVWLIYSVSPSKSAEMRIVPALDKVPRGVFATRSLFRPNPIGLSCVRLLRVEGDTLTVEGLDMLDGAALLDVKPYVPRYDAYIDAWAGWLENRIPHQAAWRDGAAMPT